MRKLLLGLVLSTVMMFATGVQLVDTAQIPNVPSVTVMNVTTPIDLRTTTVFGLYGWSLFNPTGNACFVEVFNTTAANVVLGVTVPVFIIPIGQHLPSTASFPLPIKSPGATSTLGDNGVSIAAVTMPNGNITCSPGISGSFVLTNN